MKEILILTVGLLLPILVLGQSELAMINDPDGFVNVRAEKNTESKIVTTIKKNSFFLCEPEDGNWWKVENFYSKTGFVHKSRIQLIKDLTEKQQRDLIIYSINGLKDYRLKYDSLRLILSNEKRMELVREFEDFEDTNYTPLLPFISKLFCKTKDIDLLDNFLKIIIINKMSANESPAWTLGDCYICHPDLVIKEIENFNNKNREVLWGILNFGFESVTWQKEDEIKNYKELKSKLKE